jgi:hypothetical protein
VVDKAGAPIEGAMVRGDYLGATSTDGSVERGQTDDKGVAVIAGRSAFHVNLTVSKEGYYPTRTKIYPKDSVDKKEHFRDRKVTVVLKEKRNPIPLYAKRYSGEIPVAEEWLGFDLEAGDWVVPYGKGVRADVQFWFQGKIDSFDSGQGELKLKFDDDNGFAEISDVSPQSELKVPHLAPVDGYVSEEKIWRAAIRKEVDGRPSSNKFYFMRLRTRIDSQGEVETATYAKLYGDVFFSLRGRHGGVSRVQFQYYFNPTPNDRNLEFDTYRNLFRNLPHEEQVREP